MLLNTEQHWIITKRNNSDQTEMTATASDLSQKTDEEIQEELGNIKKRLYDRLDTQLEKDLIIEEREKLAVEKRNLDVQMRFLKQKMKNVYEDELIKRENQTKLQQDTNDFTDQAGENVFYDLTRNGPVSPPTASVAPRRSRWHPEVGRVSGPDLRHVQTTIDNKNRSYKPNTPR